MKIGIIGNGMVGSTTARVLSEFCEDVFIYDANPQRSLYDIRSTVLNSDVLFVCLPTPTDAETGKFDLSILHSVLTKINNICRKQDVSRITAIRSTVIPGTCEELATVFKNLHIVHYPEFFTARISDFGFRFASQCLLGYTDGSDIAFLEKFIAGCFGRALTIAAHDTELVKLALNSFFACKIAIMNVIFQLERKHKPHKRRFDEPTGVRECLLADGRITPNHTQVPGHDGMFGFGGGCLPKDLLAMIQYCKSQKVDSSIFQSVFDFNHTLREDFDPCHKNFTTKNQNRPQAKKS